MALSIPSPKDDTPEPAPPDPAAEPRDADAARRALRGERAPEREAGRTKLRTMAEWVTLAVSTLIVVGLIALTAYFYVTSPSTPAAVEVEPRLAETYQSGSRYYLPLTVRNTGGETGEEVRIRVSVTDASGRQEAAEVMIQFLAGGGSSKAVAAFGTDPRQGQVEAVVVSYLEP